MKKLLELLLILILVVVFVEIGYIAFFSQNKSQKLTSSNKSNITQSISPTPFIFQIISQDRTDKEGRTVIYESSNSNVLSAYEGNGYIVGYFDKLEDIKNSTDKYLYLKGEGKRTSFKFRLVYEPTKYSTWTVISRLAIENLNLVKEGYADGALTGLASIKSFDKDLSNIFKKDDILAIRMKMPNNEVLKDNEETIIAPWIIIRRWGDKLDIK